MADYSAEHYCPVFNEVIDPDRCYFTLGALLGLLPADETEEVWRMCRREHELAKRLCTNCPYSRL